MNLKALFIVFVVFYSMAVVAQNVSRDGFYAAFASGEIAKIDEEAERVAKSGDANKEGLEGALIMRKAAFVKGNGKKLSLFKAGHKKLEGAIAKNSGNIELRLIRLMVQENSPKMLKYNKDIDADSQLVKDNFKKLSPKLQEVVTAYSKNSKALSTAQL